MAQQPIDRAAFLAACAAAAQPKLNSVTLPGIGSCYRRQLTAGDVLDAQDISETLKAAGMDMNRKLNMAIGLAQTLCDEAGQPLFEATNPDHARMLSALPWAAVRGVLGADEAATEPEGPNA